jgi:hypothetical protein
MSPFRACYLRRFNLKDNISSGHNILQDNYKKSPKESMFASKLRSKSEGMRNNLLPSTNMSGWGSRFYMKKILCHKLKRKHQYQNKKQQIMKDVMKRVQLFRSFSDKKRSLYKQEHSVDSFLKSKIQHEDILTQKSETDQLSEEIKTKKVSFLKLDNSIPELSLEMSNENDLNIEDGDSSGHLENMSFTLSFPKSISKKDLSTRPILAFLRNKKNEGKR